MIIKEIDISNYKSYKRLNIDLSDFNVLIGSNAAGKSNCINSLSFFKDIVNEGLENAISMQGGINYLKNLNSDSINETIDFRIRFSPDKVFKFYGNDSGNQYIFEIKEFYYHFCLQLQNKIDSYVIQKDSLQQTFDLFKLVNNKAKYISTHNFVISKKKEKFNFEFDEKKDFIFNLKDLKKILFIGFEDFTIEKRLLKTSELKKSLILETPLYFMPHIETLKRDFSKISIYDFDPRSPKKSTSIAGKSELMEGGENLAIVLKKILRDNEQKRRFLNYLNFLLPYVENLEIENILDKYLQIVLKETYSKEKLIPGFLLSDGTIFILAIITALFFEEKPIVIFEEPERRVHPFLISKIIDLMKDASVNKQIILSTHNPEIVKYAGLENIHYISRDKNGYSTVLKINEKEEIKTFLENEIGIEELFIQDLIK